MAAQLPAVQTFPFNALEIRTRLDYDGGPWFCANDVCKAIGIAQPRDAVQKLDEDERDDVGISDAIGRLQQTTFISESGLYTLILRSQDAVTPGTPAHKFRKWVTSEVLPKLRKHGYFGQARPTERLAAIKTSAMLMERMARATDWSEQCHLWELQLDLCWTLGIKPPDLAKLGKKPEALAGVQS